MKKIPKFMSPLACVTSLLCACATPPDPYPVYEIPLSVRTTPEARIFFTQVQQYVVGMSTEQAIKLFNLPPYDRHWRGEPFQSTLYMTLPSRPDNFEGCHLELMVENGRVVDVVSTHNDAESFERRVGHCAFAFDILDRYVRTGKTQAEYWDEENRKLREHYQRVAQRRRLELMSAEPYSKYILFVNRYPKYSAADNSVTATFLYHLTSPSQLANGATFRSIKETVRIDCGLGEAVTQSMGYYSGEYGNGSRFNPPPGEPRVFPLFGAEKRLCERFTGM